MSHLTVQSILISEIDDAVRLRPLNQAAVQKLTLSMQKETQGGVARHQINPLTVRAKAAGGFTLVTGAHRLAAARLLGWKQIDVIVTEMSDEDALEAEVDENLYRADLTGADRALFIKKKLELYTYAGGKLSRGRSLSKRPTVGLLESDFSGKDAADQVIRFYEELEKKFGIKRSTAKKLVRRGRRISAALLEWIQNSKKPVPDCQLDKLAELEPDDRNEVEHIVLSGSQSLAAALKKFSNKRARSSQTPEDIARGLEGIWAKWSASERSRFIKILKKNG